MIHHFYPRSPCGERPQAIYPSSTPPKFLSTLSLRRATAPPNYNLMIHHFYPRSPCGERPQAIYPSSTPPPFLSTLSLRRATAWLDYSDELLKISIHALLAESDFKILVKSHGNNRFLSTLSLRRATLDTLANKTPFEFLSTLSLRRATFIFCSMMNTNIDFYPRSPCGERPTQFSQKGQANKISIHALLAESDLRNTIPGGRHVIFLSTLSLRRATANPFPITSPTTFLSTLSLRRATDVKYKRDQTILFLSTLSLRRATDVKYKRDQTILFLSTLSLRRATAKVHKTVGHFCAYGTNFMGIASSC